MSFMCENSIEKKIEYNVMRKDRETKVETV